MVAMSRTAGPMPKTNGAPGLRSWCTTSPSSDSAAPCATCPATVIGAVPPARGDVEYTHGMPRSAHTSSLSTASSGWRRALVGSP